MGWVAAASAVLSIISSVAQGQAQKKAANQAAQREEALAAEQRSIGEQNALAVEAEGMEQARRQGLQQSKEEAAARAAAAASGAAYDPDDPEGVSSIALSLKSQKDENTRSLDWTKTATKSQADAARRNANLAAQSSSNKASSYRSTGSSAALTGWINAATSAGKSYQSGAFGSWGSGSAADEFDYANDIEF